MPGEERQLPSKLAGFRVVSELGRGGMGVVYEGWDEKLLRRVALKLLAEHLSSSADLRERFLREARAAAALSHPNICAVHAIETCDDGRLLLVMELVEGQSLRARLVAGDLSRGDARTVALGVAGALAKAHTVGIVHRDLKPENVMVTDDGAAKLLDFGIAKALARGPVLDTSASALTGSGQVVGTAGYIAPEQIEGLDSDQRVDVFAFGVVLFEMLGGVRPFDAATPVQRMVAVLRDAPAELVAADVSPALRDLLGRCLAKRADERPHDGAALLRELGEAWPSASSSSILVAAALGTAQTEAEVDTPAARRSAISDLATAPTEVVDSLPSASSSPPAPTAAALATERTRATGATRAATPAAPPRRRAIAAVAAFGALGALATGAMLWTRHEGSDEPRAWTPASGSSSAPVSAAPSSPARPTPASESSPSSASTNKSRSARSGRLPPEVIQTTIRDRFQALEKCAERVGPRAVARSVWFVIALDGSTRDVAVREVDPSLAEVDACLVSAFSAFQFPKPEGGVVTVTYPIQFGNPGTELDDSACAAGTACLEEGRCSIRDDRCAVVTDADCRLAQVCTEGGACTADRGRCRAKHTDCSATAEACRRHGLCTATEGLCRATKDEDCGRSTACGAYGLCAAFEGACRAPSSDVCEQSWACKSDGRCAEVGGDCVANSAAHCEASRACIGRGQCVLRAGVCVASRDEDCRKSAECRSEGRCKVGATLRCIAGSDDDCKASRDCEAEGECRAVDGLCQE